MGFFYLDFTPDEVFDTGGDLFSHYSGYNLHIYVT